MKIKKLILALSLLLSLNFYAQTEKGHFLIGGNSNFTFTSTKKSIDGNKNSNSKTYITLSPEIGYFVINDLSIGLLASYTNAVNKGPIEHSFLAGPFLRYYFAQSDKLMPFAHTAVSFGSNSFSFMTMSVTGDPYGERKVSSDIFKYEFDLGLSVLLSQKISFDVMLGYSNTKEDLPVFDIDENMGTTEITTGTIGLNLGLSVFLGK